MKPNMNGVKNALGGLLSGKKVRFGGYATLITLAVIAGLILVNLIVQQFNAQLDLTTAGLFSITEQTEEVIAAVDSPVEILMLFEPGGEPTQLREVVEEYTRRSTLITYRVVDPERDPGLVARFRRNDEAINRGSIIVEGEKGFRIIRNQDMYDVSFQNPRNPRVMGFSLEKRLTSALVYVSTGETPVIYELTGHDQNPISAFNMLDLIERENFEIRQLSLLTEPRVPDDAALLVINAPKKDLTRGEADKILEYLGRGGRLFALVDFQIGEAPILNDLLSSYGVNVDFGVVIEMDHNYNTGNPFQMRPTYQEHDIMSPLERNNIDVILQYPLGIRNLEARRASIEIEPLLTSSDLSFLRTDLDNASMEKVEGDRGGPVVMAAAVKDVLDAQAGKETRLVVAGTGLLLDPIFPYGQIPGNIDFFMNSLGWLNDRPETITVSSRSLITFPMRLTGLQIIIFAVLFVLFIPLTLFAVGFVVWLRRRHL